MLSHYRQYRRELNWIARARETADAIDQLSETIFTLPSKEHDEESQANRARCVALSARRDALLQSMEADIPWYAKIIPVK